MKFKKWCPYLLIIILIVIGTTQESAAQKIDWGIELNGFADNREYKSSVQIPQSMLGTRLNPYLGLRKDSLHSIVIGLDLLKEFGSVKVIDDVDFQMYYRFTGYSFRFTFGSFSKEKIYRTSPRAIYYDSLIYFKPNMNGLLWTFKNNGFKQSVYLDWTSRQTETERETFIMGGFGEFVHKEIFIKNHIYMYHFAGPAIKIPGDHLRDNGVAYLSTGLNLGNTLGLDSISISVGGIMSFERTRNAGGWQTPAGLLIESTIEHKGFGISNTTYFGEGHNLDWGDPFYRLKKYSRLNIYFMPLLFENTRAKFGISLHFAEGKVNHQQQFFLKVSLNSGDSGYTDGSNRFLR
jgi:hypothetical protein